MELRHLRYFVAVAEELNFTRAAGRMNTSQPSLGQQIRDLEAEIGTQLLYRDRHHVELTAPGRILLTEARELLKRAELAKQKVSAASRDVVAITIGVVAAAEVKIFPVLLPRLGQHAQNISVVIRHLTSFEQLKELRNCSIDGGFLGGPIVDAEIEWVELLTEAIVVILPSGHPAAMNKKITLEKLKGLHCIGASGALAPALSQALTPFFEAAKTYVTFSQDAANLLGQINLVRAGRGFAVLPDYVRYMLPKGTVARPLDWDPPLSIALGFGWLRANQSKALKQFRHVLTGCRDDFSRAEIRVKQP